MQSSKPEQLRRPGQGTGGLWCSEMTLCDLWSPPAALVVTFPSWGGGGGELLGKLRPQDVSALQLEEGHAAGAGIKGNWSPLESVPLSLPHDSQDGEVYSSHLPGPELFLLSQEAVAKVSCSASPWEGWPCEINSLWHSMAVCMGVGRMPPQLPRLHWVLRHCSEGFTHTPPFFSTTLGGGRLARWLSPFYR